MSDPLVIATGNAHKVVEISAILGGRFAAVPQTEFAVSPVAETGLTFVENALIKARHAAQETGMMALADDSGIEVPALGGRPGIYSARFAGENAEDADNVTKLLLEMKNITDRRARFQCVIVLLRHAGDPVPLIAQGTWTGELLHEPRGESGFGYDPVFQPRGYDVSAAELTPTDKNAISHRARALTQLARLLDDLPPHA